jgi:hypothetical protein
MGNTRAILKNPPKDKIGKRVFSTDGTEFTQIIKKEELLSFYILFPSPLSSLDRIRGSILGNF